MISYETPSPRPFARGSPRGAVSTRFARRLRAATGDHQASAHEAADGRLVATWSDVFGNCHHAVQLDGEPLEAFVERIGRQAKAPAVH